MDLATVDKLPTERGGSSGQRASPQGRSSRRATEEVGSAQGRRAGAGLATSPAPSRLERLAASQAGGGQRGQGLGRGQRS